MDKATWTAALRRGGLTVYPSSAEEADGTLYAIVRGPQGKRLAVSGRDAGAFRGAEADGVRLCPLEAANAATLMERFPHTRPRSHGASGFSIGLGDRLGLATPGHIRAVRGFRVFPVLAQQSIRELTLTGRTYRDVIAAACFAVFQEGWYGGYGADGDHLKTAEEIDGALDSGCTMITLDCSQVLGPAPVDTDGLRAAYAAVPPAVRSRYARAYLGRAVPSAGVIDETALQEIVTAYWRAVEHARQCYLRLAARGGGVDFELSIDESLQETSPAAHFVIASELLAAGVRLTGLAPHFHGAFEKGVDYAGSLERLEAELTAHQAVAEQFGYRLSLHSGSDKFSVFPSFGRITGCSAHVKTAGTSWLEALRVVAVSDPALFRRSLSFAMDRRASAEAYYRVSHAVSEIVPPAARTDAELPLYLEEAAARQTLHIAYGLLLAEPWFRAPFFRLMEAREDAYAAGLVRHIGRHLQALTGTPPHSNSNCEV